MINLKLLIKNTDVDPDQLAPVLFPGNKHPALALKRVLDGHTQLNESQIRALGDYMGITVQELFDYDQWTSKKLPDHILFTKGDYTARLDPETLTTVIFYKGKQVTETVIHGKTVALGDYISRLDQVIKTL